MTKEGGKVIGIIEHDCGIYNEDGFDVDDVKLHMTINNSILDYSKARKINSMDPTEFLKYECDVFAPCAGDSTINVTNAKDIKAKVVIEGANGPTTFKADQILAQRGIQVVPDLLANVGGVTVSYFEWLKNIDHVAPGRMTKKHKEEQNKKLIKMLGYKFPDDSPLMSKLQGAREIDIVYSGLEEIMVTAT